MVARHPQKACPCHPHRVFGRLPSSVVAVERRCPPVVHPQRRTCGMALGQRLASAWRRVVGCRMDVPRGRRGVGDSPLGRGEQAGFLTVAGVKRLGLIGHPVGHSQSPRLFADRFERLGRHDVTYEAFDLPDISTFPTWSEDNPDVVGLNVTVPHKSAVMPYLHSLGNEAAQIGAVKRWCARPKDGWGTTPTLGGSGAPFSL